MRTVPSGFATKLAHGSASSTFLVTFTLKTGDVLRFTEWDADLSFGGNTYASLPGMTVGSIPYGLDGFSSGVDIVVGATFGSPIDAHALRDGVYDAAEVEIREVDAENPADAVYVFWGRVSNITRQIEGRVTISAKGVLSGGAEIVVQRYMPMCIWYFCGFGCGLNAADYTYTGTISAIPDAYSLTLSGAVTSQADDAFTNGVMTITSGTRQGLRVEVRGWTQSGGALKTFLAHPKGLAVGDTVSVLRGCAKRFQDCQAYGNQKRFGGQHKAGPPADANSISFIEWGS